MVYSPRQRAAAAHVLVVLEVDLAPGDADDAGAQHRAQPRRGRPRPCRGTISARAPPRPDRAGCRAGTCPASPPSMSTANSSSRLSCSDRTPTMKKLPRPTASRTMRVWLPGATRCSTAWRSGNDRDRASGAIAAISSVPARCSTSAVAGEARQRRRARCAASRLPRGQRRPGRRTTTTSRRSARSPVAARVASSRSSSDGLTCRTSSSGTSENSSDTSSPMPRPCSDRRPA